ncbi:MAG: N-6 DNA methylase [Oscillospiraceae bacterium]|nr:N-6 DNA methylase [Oscillospiraceae bacterium]
MKTTIITDFFENTESPSEAALASLAAALLDIRETDNVLEFCGDNTAAPVSAYNKIFAHFPLGVKRTDTADSLEELQKHFGFPISCIERCSSDWLFTAKTLRALHSTGKAVVIMAAGAASTKNDMLIRKFFAENGYIEAVINLPGNLLEKISIPITMVVFSSGNKCIRLVDAAEIYTRIDRKRCTLSETQIAEILCSVNNPSDNGITVTVKEMAEHEFCLQASHYLKQPLVKNGVPLGTLLRKITRGSQIKPDVLAGYRSDTPTAYRIITLSNIVNGALEIEENEQYLSELPKSLEKFVVPKNAVLLSKMASPTFRSMVFTAETECSIIATGNFYILEIDETKADPCYLQAFFESAAGEEILEYVSGGSAVKVLSLEAVKGVLIPLPSLEKQKQLGKQYRDIMEQYLHYRMHTKKLLEQKRHLAETAFT